MSFARRSRASGSGGFLSVARSRKWFGYLAAARGGSGASVVVVMVCGGRGGGV